MPPSSSVRPWEALLDDLRAEFEIREAELSLLHEIDLEILRNERELPGTLEFIARKTADLLSAEWLQIYLRRGTLLEAAVKQATDPEASIFPHAKSIFSSCVEENAPIMVNDLESEFTEAFSPLGEGPTGSLKGLVAVPISLGETVLGVLCAAHTEAARFGQTHIEISQAIAAQIAIALEHAELFDQSQLFEQVDSLIFSQAATEDVLQKALDAVFEELLRLDYAKVKAAQLLFLRGPRELEIVHSTEQRDVGLLVSVDDSVSGRALDERRALVINDVSADPQYKRMLGADIQSEIAVPILIGADEVAIGVLNVESHDRAAFGGVYQLLLERFARKVTMLLAVTKLRKDIANTLETHHSEELMIAVGDQASNMVHKMNNVVGAMRVRVKEIQENCAAEVEGSDFLRESLEYLIKRTDETLDLPRRVQSFLAQDSELSEFDVNEAITKALGNVQLPEGIDVDCSLEDGIPMVRSFSLDVAAENLIRNAVDAMPEGGVLTITSKMITVSDIPGGRVELIFSDTGSGMSPDTRRRLFDIDFTTKPRKKGKGMGVGLWWVRQWVRRSGGEVDVHTREGEGTTFVIKLPLTSDNGGLSPSPVPVQKGG